MSSDSYIDYDLFLDPAFSAPQFANTLVLATNNATDTPLDLSTPLSRVLFDIQDVDSHIHTLTTSKALPLLEHTQTQNTAAKRIGDRVEEEVKDLNTAYKRLEEEVIGRYDIAEEVRSVSERLWQTVRLGRVVGRALQLGRQLEIQMAEIQATINANAKAREDHRAMIRAANTIVSLKGLYKSSTTVGGESEGLEKVLVMQTLQSGILVPAERMVSHKAERIIREFSMSTLSSTGGSTTYIQSEDTKSRTASALLTLYILSPSQHLGSGDQKVVEGEAMVRALHDYLRTSLTSSLASLSRSLGTLPTLEKTCIEVSARCQNIVALELLLGSVNPFTSPTASTAQEVSAQPATTTLLHPLLASLETPSLPSYFWRTLASNLSGKVAELMMKGGVQARTLKTRKEFVRECMRECVIRGSQPPTGSQGSKKSKAGEGWEREAAVMVGSVVGHLGR